jgi:hypothetical protein
MNIETVFQAMEIDRLIQTVKAHPMCLRFTDDHGVYLVIYPEGIWPQGVQAAYTGQLGKAGALERILMHMENHWKLNGVH